MNKKRRQLILSGSLGLFGILSSQLAGAIPDSQDGEPVIVQPEEGETYWVGGRNSPLTIMISKDRQGNESMCFCREEIASGEAIPVHKHLNEDELIFAYAGEATMRIGQKEIILKQGAVALIPKGVWHGVRNAGKEKFIMVFSYSPAGFEGYFREMGSPAGTPWQPKSQAEFDRLEKKWGIVYE